MSENNQHPRLDGSAQRPHESPVENLPARFNPEMLILARSSRGLTQTELAAKVGVTQSRISKLEDGLTGAPDEAFTDRLARALEYPVHFFFSWRGARAACASFYRKKSALPARLLNMCDARMNIQRMHVEQLVKAAEIEARQLPSIDPDEIEGGARGAARQIRTYWGIPRGPLKGLTQLVEDAGCVVIQFDFGTRQLDGLSLFTNDGTPVIFLNKDMPSDRLRFTLAHELGHIIMHKLPKAEMETEAHEFASELLMPADEIRSSFYPLSLDVLARLKLYWQVSMAALLKRAEDLGSVSERYARVLWMQMGKFGYRSVEPHQDQLVREIPSLLGELVTVHLAELEYTRDQLAHVLALTRAEFDRMYPAAGAPKFEVLATDPR